MLQVEGAAGQVRDGRTKFLLLTACHRTKTWQRFQLYTE
jgi:hypothetical protein